MADSELERLRQEVEALRQREVDDLRKQVEQLIAERNHYRDEAHRNAELGRQIASQGEAEINALNSQLNAYRNAGLQNGINNGRAADGLGRASSGQPSA